MSEHRASLQWRLGSGPFDYETFTRDHTIRFEGGVELAASAAPQYRGNPSRVDPESQLVASLSSCHMLTFLAICVRRKFVVESYDDEAVGHLEKNAQGKFAITRVELNPKIVFSAAAAPTAEELASLHERAHADCFIANSVTTKIDILLA